VSWRRTHDWGALTSDEIGQARDAGAFPVLPAGSVEQHARHLPVDTDLVSAHRIALAAAERCADAFALVLPGLPFGFAPEHAAWPGTVTLSLATFLALIGEVAQSVHRTGFDRLLVVNGHGGNQAALAASCAELAGRGIDVVAVNYCSPGQGAWSRINPGAKPTMGHACAYETSLQLALRPGERERIVRRIAGLPPRLVPPGIVSSAQPFRDAGAAYPGTYPATDPGYYGDPAAANQEAGETMLGQTVDALAAFYAAFAATEFVRPA
jgi:creatinine amidohydrolase